MYRYVEYRNPLYTFIIRTLQGEIIWQTKGENILE